MKVLFVTASPVNMETSVGNTFLNILPDGVEAASLYTKVGLPDERVSKAFCVNEGMLLKLKGGADIYGRYSPECSYESKKRHGGFMDFARRNRSPLLYMLQNLIWRSPVWKSKKLDSFLNDCDSDVIFSLLANNIFLNRLLLYVKKKTGLPLVIYAWDNNYYDNPYEESFIRRHLHKREKKYMQKIVSSADKLYVISSLQKQDYEREFGRECTVLTKNVSVGGQKPCQGGDNSPLEIVYTGGLGVNRWKTLSLIADALRSINSDGVKAKLLVYSSTPVDAKIKAKLDDGESSFLCGSVSADRIPDIQKNADILVHAEAFDDKSRFAVKYSFSTKIADYLSSARPIFAAGPADIASVDFFLKTDCAAVATSPEEILTCLEKLISDKELRKEYADRAYEYGKKQFSRELLTKKLYRELNSVIQGGGEGNA